MNKIKKNSAETKWDKSSISFKNYQNYINKKEDKFKLTLIDLLYISNFKGGNATTHEPEDTIEEKLKFYTDILIKIDNKFKDKELAELNNNEVEELWILIEKICNLTNKNLKTKIDGFSVSYLSALLNAYFTKLIPILDRRILINMKLVESKDLYKSKQVKDIFTFYKSLILKMKKESETTKQSIRDIDYKYFIMQIDKNIYINN
jgi:hypothetical protein